jgi:hypothetical protein
MCAFLHTYCFLVGTAWNTGIDKYFQILKRWMVGGNSLEQVGTKIYRDPSVPTCSQFGWNA